MTDRDRIAAIVLPLIPGGTFIGVVRRDELADDIADALIAAGVTMPALCGDRAERGVTAANTTATHDRTERPEPGPLPPRTHVAGIHR